VEHHPEKTVEHPAKTEGYHPGRKAEYLLNRCLVHYPAKTEGYHPERKAEHLLNRWLVYHRPGRKVGYSEKTEGCRLAKTEGYHPERMEGYSERHHPERKEETVSLMLEENQYCLAETVKKSNHRLLDWGQGAQLQTPQL